ncbi:MAG TPA: DUF4197 domain-containing protein [bacterium]|nr:DUF4197 domain-containing protein [bacterium]HOL68139.1 DUF4197 domain-containing protein [bacterium]HPP11163.1 DUF4197 domain-containing protein [bacterium]
MKLRLLLVLLFGSLCLSLSTAEAGFLDILLQKFGISSRSVLSEEKIVAGLKEALSVGTENAVNLTGKVDGYFANAAIKILLPENVRKMEDVLRLLGYGPKLDDFVLSMNRAAEKAAPFARNIFLEAITQITFDDARKILNGGETAITDFFKTKTYDSLTLAFTPVVKEQLDAFSVTAKYKAIVEPYQKLPFAEKIAFLDLDGYVVARALDGLFYILASEEKNIRKNPAARVTQLLKEVFR